MQLETKSLETKDGASAREIKEAFADFRLAFEAFKEANDGRLAELEKRGGDVVSEEKVDRINRALDEQKKALDELTLSAARPLMGETKAMPDRATRERKAAFDRYMRKGDVSGFSSLEVKALSEGSNPDGGYVVPLEIGETIDRILAKASPIRAIASVQQIGSSVYRKPITSVAAASGWTGETGAVSQTATPTISAIDFPAMELYAMPAATQPLLDDAQVDIEQWLAGEVQIVFAEQEGAAFVSGDGSNKPTGFLHYTAVADASWSWGQCRLHRQRRGRRLRVVQSVRRADQPGLRPQAGLSRQWHLGDEPQDRERRAQVQGHDRQLHLAARCRGGPAGEPLGLSGDGSRGHAGHRVEFVFDCLRRFRARLPHRRPRRHPHPARSVQRQAVHPVLHHQARRRRSAELRGDQADEVRGVVKLDCHPRRARSAREGDPGGLTGTGTVRFTWVPFPSLRSAGDDSFICGTITMPLELVTAPALEPVTLDEAKAHLKIDVSDDDALITTLIAAARARAEWHTGRAFVTQGWRLWLDAWPCEPVEIPLPPLQSVSAVTVYARDDSAAVLDASAYQIAANRIAFKTAQTNLRRLNAVRGRLHFRFRRSRERRARADPPGDPRHRCRPLHQPWRHQRRAAAGCARAAGARIA